MILKASNGNREEIIQLLKPYDVGFKLNIQKEATALAIFSVIVSNIDKIAIALILLHSYYRHLSDDNDSEIETPPGSIKLPNGDTIDIESLNWKELLKKLEESMGEELELDYESMDRQEVLDKLGAGDALDKVQELSE